MTSNYLPLLLLIGSLLTATSCQKDKDNDPTDTGYMSLKMGNEWLYVSQTDGQRAEYSLRVVGDSTINGRTYAKLLIDHPDDNNPRYLYSDATTVRGVNFFVYNGGSTTTLAPEWELVRPEAPVGTSWTNEIESRIVVGSTSVTTQTRYKMTVEERDLSKMVRNQTYTGVIKLRVDVSSAYQGQQLNLGTEYHYWTPGAGFILQEGDFAMTELVSFNQN